MSYEEEQSILQKTPKSIILSHGYINVYSELTPSEKRQLRYKELYKELNPSWDESQIYLTNFVKGLKNESLIVLDAGCGHGNYVIDENRHTIKWAVGIDIDKDSTSKNVCLDEIKIEPLSTTSLSSDSFGLCVCLWVFEHLENPDEVFLEIHRLLKPGGYFVFATPNASFFPVLLNRAIKSRKLNNLANKSLFGRKSEDIFKTFYKANSIPQIKKLAGNNFFIESLFYNYDPSYTSFNKVTFILSGMMSKFFSAFPQKPMHAHLVGIMRKN